MNRQDMARRIILDQQARYPRSDADDQIKALYQAAFGCGHFVRSEADARAWLREEMNGAQGEGPLIEPIGDRYARVHLSAFAGTGAQESTLARLFVLTSQDAADDTADADFQAGLDAMVSMSETGELRLDAQAVKARVAAYRAQGCPALHHSAAFRAAYQPAYRVVRASWAAFLPLLARLDALRTENRRVCVAIDGASASGKTTLAALLQAVYGACVLHMDDFFLQPHQRTAERFAQPGGNVDYERFLEEVLEPLRAGRTFLYRAYDCRSGTIRPGVVCEGAALNVVEGAYSLHPALEAYYDLRVLIQIDPPAQRARILERNGEAMLTRFVQEWIPLEQAYFEKTDIEKRCDMIWRVEASGSEMRCVQGACACGW